VSISIQQESAAINATKALLAGIPLLAFGTVFHLRTEIIDQALRDKKGSFAIFQPGT
jgi:hypothetical protein